MIRRLGLLLLLLAALARCHDDNPAAPEEDRRVRGRLAGVVTIGPNCPHEDANKPCPTPPEAYSLRKILVYDEAKTKVLNTVDIDSGGLYVIDLLPGRYTVDINHIGIDRSSDVPKTVEIVPLNVTKLDIAIDTGLR